MRILVTGGASRLGAEISSHLLSLGYELTIHYHTHPPLHRESIQCDFTDTAKTSSLVDTAIEQFGPIQALVLNASAWHLKNLENWERDFQINLTSSRILCAAFAQSLMGNGMIIFILDSFALHGMKSSPIYAATKYAALGLMKSQAKALAPRIRVNAISPGLILPTNIGTTPSQFIPLGIGHPQSACDAITFLMNNAYVNGINLQVNGGVY